MKFVKGVKFKICPKCKFWVEKNQGCNHMKCRWGTDFCYLCGDFMDRMNVFITIWRLVFYFILLDFLYIHQNIYNEVLQFKK